MRAVKAIKRGEVLKQGRWIQAIAAAVMLVDGVVSLVDGRDYGWLLIAGALLAVVALVLPAPEQRRPDR